MRQGRRGKEEKASGVEGGKKKDKVMAGNITGYKKDGKTYSVEWAEEMGREVVLCDEK